MKEIITLLENCSFYSADQFNPTESEMNQFGMKLTVDSLKGRGIPSQYLYVIEHMSDEPNKKQAISKIASLLLFLRSKYKDQVDISLWLRNGRLPEMTSNGSASMSYLIAKTNKIAKIQSTIESNNIKIRNYGLKSKRTSQNLTAESNLNEKNALLTIEKIKAERDFVESLIEIEAIIGSGRSQ